MNKIIGVSPLYDSEKDSYWMVPGYIKMLEIEGAVPLILPLTSDKKELDCLFNLCGGFLLTGGQDVSPSLYGAKRSPMCGELSPERDEMDSYILKRAVDENKPILGICRGIQLMNAALGGTLYQDLPSEHGNKVNHHMSPPYDRAAHSVNIVKGGALGRILEKEKIGVNSYHHQAVKNLAPALKAVAISEDGIIEAVEMPLKRFILGVQWHPEFSYLTDENNRKIVRAFVEAIPWKN